MAKPQYGHDHDADLLPECRRHALGAHGLIGLSEQSEYGVAKLAQAIGPPTRRECLFNASAGNTREG